MKHKHALSTFLAFSLPTTVAAPFASPAYVDDGQRAALQARIESLEAEIQSLLDAQRVDQHQRARELRQIVHDVLLDADTRSNLLNAQGTRSGWDGHPFIASEDGNFYLQFWGRVQSRYVLNSRDDEEGQNGAVDTLRDGFEIRRARLNFEGHVIDPSITFQIQSGFDRNGGSLELLNTWIRKTFANSVYLQAGQDRPPFMFESLTSSGRQLTVERSIVHSAMGVGRTQGVEVGYEDEHWRLRGSLHDGSDLQNVPALAEATEFAVTGRAEWLLQGSWSQFKQFTSPPGSEAGFMVGGALHYQIDEFGTSTDNEVQDLRWTMDANLMRDGWSVFGAIVGRHTDADDDGSDQFGAVLQGATYLNEQTELFARYLWGDDDSGFDDLHVLGVGINLYFDHHDLKWTTDLSYAFGPVSEFWASSGAGWRADPSSDTEGQTVFRSQLQLQF